LALIMPFGNAAVTRASAGPMKCIRSRAVPAVRFHWQS
jgi:hypothetical protein